MSDDPLIIDKEGIADHDIDLSVGQQYEFVTSTASYAVAIAGIGGGKTKAGSIKAALLCGMYPEHKGLICANTVRQLEDYTVASFLETLEEYGINYETKVSKKQILVETEEGIWAEVHYRSIENYNNIRGGEYAWIWLDEARDYNPAAFDVIVGRVGREKTDFKQQIFITTTPRGEDWINDRFIDEESEEYLQDVELFQWTTMDNHFLDPGYADKLKDAYDVETYRQEVLGQVVDTQRGALYSMFQTSKHCLNNDFVDYDPHRPLIWCIDFNVDPFCTTVIQQHGQITYVIDEVVLKNATCDEIVEEMKYRYPPKTHYSELQIYGDATGRNRNHQTKRSDWAAIELAILNNDTHLGRYDYFIKRKKSNPRIVERVKAVNARFENVKGEKRLYILKKCKYTLKDCKRMKKDEGTWEPDPKQIKKEKTLGHCMDTVGYFIYANYPLTKMEDYRQVKRRG